MSSALIAIVLVLLLSHFRPELARWRQLQPLQDALARLAARAGATAVERLPAVLLRVVLPGVLLFLLHWLLADYWFGLPALLVAVASLFLCWGPRDLEADVLAVREAQEPDARLQARRALGLSVEGDDSAAAVGQVFRLALERWFGVLLWFLLLGPAGALMFRLERNLGEGRPAQGSALAALRVLFEWPAAQLMALALAVVGNFDAVLQAWQDWHRQRGAGWLVAETGFLEAAARCSVDCERREHREELEDNAPADAVDDSLGGVLADALGLLWRMLLAWLVVLALLVIAGIAS